MVEASPVTAYALILAAGGQIWRIKSHQRFEADDYAISITRVSFR